jgi:hypothetical protein
MIKETDRLKYDYDDSQYYITPQTIVNELSVSDAEMKKSFGDTDKKQSIEIRRLCQRVYDYMFSYNLPENNKYLTWRIYSNQRRERYFLKQAMKSFVFAAIESGMDLNEYISTPDHALPKEVINNLKNAQLINIGLFHGDVPDGDY